MVRTLGRSSVVVQYYGLVSPNGGKGNHLSTKKLLRSIGCGFHHHFAS